MFPVVAAFPEKSLSCVRRIPAVEHTPVTIWTFEFMIVGSFWSALCFAGCAPTERVVLGSSELLRICVWQKNNNNTFFVFLYVCFA